MATNNIRCRFLLRDDSETQLGSTRTIQEMPDELRDQWTEAIIRSVASNETEQDGTSVSFRSITLNQDGTIEIANDSANPDTEIQSAHYQPLTEAIDALATNEQKKDLSVHTSENPSRAVTFNLLHKADFTSDIIKPGDPLGAFSHGLIKSAANIQKLTVQFYGLAFLKLSKDISAWVRANPYKAAGIFGGITLFALACATPAILGAVGFSAVGPVAGSIAAGWQASVGSVAAGSFFAFLQSAAMGGAAMGVFTGIGALGGVTAIVAVVASSKDTVGELGEKIHGAIGAGVASSKEIVSGLGEKIKGFWGKKKDD